MRIRQSILYQWKEGRESSVAKTMCVTSHLSLHHHLSFSGEAMEAFLNHPGSFPSPPLPLPHSSLLSPLSFIHSHTFHFLGDALGGGWGHGGGGGLFGHSSKFSLLSIHFPSRFLAHLPAI